MNLPANTNPDFLAWIDQQPQSVQNDIAAHWDVTATDPRLFPGHKSQDYARVTFLLEYCQENYGYA